MTNPIYNSEEFRKAKEVVGKIQESPLRTWLMFEQTEIDLRDILPEHIYKFAAVIGPYIGFKGAESGTIMYWPDRSKDPTHLPNILNADKNFVHEIGIAEKYNPPNKDQFVEPTGIFKPIITEPYKDGRFSVRNGRNATIGINEILVRLNGLQIEAKVKGNDFYASTMGSLQNFVLSLYDKYQSMHPPQ